MPDTTTMLEVRLNANEAQQEMLVALLATQGYEGFWQEASTLLAYIPAAVFDADVLAQVLQQCGAQVLTQQLLPSINWNAAWEANYEPVAVNDFCLIHASFHLPPPGYTYTVQIQPQMSFGTGHHATTQLMVQAMAGLPLAGNRVLDLGCGTGVLGILAAKMGAAAVTLVDVDEWAVRNTTENLHRNGITTATVVQGSLAQLPAQACFEVLLANIQRNVLLQLSAGLASCMAPGGYLVLSGLLGLDGPAIMASFTQLNFVHLNTLVKNSWLCIIFRAGAA